MYTQHLSSSLKVSQAYDFFLFLLSATFVWPIYPSISTTSLRPVRGNSNQSLFLLVWLKCLVGSKFLGNLLPVLVIHCHLAMALVKDSSGF